VAAQLTGGVQHVFSNGPAFAAIKSDGSVVTWGDSVYGGNSSAVAAQLVSGVTAVYSNQRAFAALKGDGSVVTWGDSANGGNSSAVAAQLSGGVAQIFSSGGAFAALKTDGSVVTWGDSTKGGNSNAVAAQLSSGVQHIFSNGSAFAALKSNGSVVTWGDSTYGGDSSAVATQLSSGVRSLASPFSTETPIGGGINLTASERIVIGGARSAMLGFTPSALAVGNVDSMGVSSIDRANETIARADLALQTISTQRARIGATLSRFDSLIGDLATAGNNLTASRSRILDADYAAETAALTRTQIIQQAGQAMLAQANTNPRLILALLRSDR
jgi:flagellin-like hook-associated protein FlgL